MLRKPRKRAVQSQPQTSNQQQPLPSEEAQDELATQEELNSWLRGRGIIGEDPKEVLRDPNVDEDRYLKTWTMKMFLASGAGYDRENPPPSRGRTGGSTESSEEKTLP